MYIADLYQDRILGQLIYCTRGLLFQTLTNTDITITTITLLTSDSGQSEQIEPKQRKITCALTLQEAPSLYDNHP